MKTEDMTPIKAARLKAGYSQTRVAQLVGVSLPSVIQWEKGVMHPGPENQRKLEEVLGIQLDEEE